MPELDFHNSPQAVQNAQQLQRLGFWDNPEDRELVRKHLQETVQASNNVVEQFMAWM